MFYYTQVVFQNKIYLNAAVVLLPSSFGIFDSRSGIMRRSTAPLRSGISISSASEFCVIIGQKCPRPSVDQWHQSDCPLHACPALLSCPARSGVHAPTHHRMPIAAFVKKRRNLKENRNIMVPSLCWGWDGSWVKGGDIFLNQIDLWTQFDPLAVTWRLAPY